jgi:hypothetical protein
MLTVRIEDEHAYYTKLDNTFPFYQLRLHLKTTTPFYSIVGAPFSVIRAIGIFGPSSARTWSILCIF